MSMSMLKASQLFHNSVAKQCVNVVDTMQRCGAFNKLTRGRELFVSTHGERKRRTPPLCCQEQKCTSQMTYLLLKGT